MPLTCDKVYAVGAMFRAGGYRAVENYLSRIKDSHLEHGHPWTVFLERSFRKVKRPSLAASARRGSPRPWTSRMRTGPYLGTSGNWEAAAVHWALRTWLCPALFD